MSDDQHRRSENLSVHPEMHTEDDIRNQQERLQITRMTLADYLRRRAIVGPAHVPPEVSHGIRDARKNIRLIVSTLRGWGVTVKDHPDDVGEPKPGHGDKKHQDDINDSKPVINSGDEDKNDDQSARSPSRLVLVAAIMLIMAVAGIIRFSINPRERNDQIPPTIAEATAPVLASTGTTTLPTPKAASLEPTMLAIPSPPSASITPTSAHISCFADYFADVPAISQVTMVVDPNVRDKRKVETGGSANDRIGILLTVNGQPIGAVRVRRLPDTAGFIIEEIVDVNCVANGHWENDDANTPHQQPANWGNTIITIGEAQYWLYMGSPGSKAPVEIITKAM